MSFISIGDKVKFKNDKDSPKFAKVIANNDPKGIGRIKVQLPGMYDPTDEIGSNLPWIRRMRTTMGIGVEEVNIPAIGDAVELYWPYDNQHAFYRGIPAGDASKLNVFEDEYNWGWGFSSGLKICVNKQTGTFLLKNNNYSIANDSDGKIVITTNDSLNSNTEKETNINSKENLTIICKANTKIKTTNNTDIISEGNTKITSTGNTTIDSTGNTTIDSIGNTNISGNNVTINGTSVKISANTTIDGIKFLDHQHLSADSGEKSSGVIVESQNQ